MLRAPSARSRPAPAPCARRLAVVAGVLALVLVLAPAPVAAQEPPAGGIAVIGTLATPAGPVAGARIEVSADGTPVGEGRTGGDGSFRVPVPGAGRYQVHLDTASLPPGVGPAPGGRDTLDNVVVFAGRDKRVAFDVVAGPAPAPGEAPTPAAAPATPGAGTLDRLLDLFLSGARFGLVIALCAVGLTLIYATTGLVNFAHGELVTFGAIVAWFLSSSGAALPLVAAAAVAFAAAALFGAAQDLALWEPLRRKGIGPISAMVVSIGLALLLRNAFLVLFDSNPRAYAQFATQEAVTAGPLRVLPKDLLTIAVCALALAGTAALLRWSRLGTAVRAVADEPDLARASGIDVRRVFLATWTLGAGLAGLGGVLLALHQGVQWDMGLRLLLVVFAAVVVGGFGSPAGAVLGGLLIGIVSEMSTYWVSPDLKDVLSLGALVVVLLVRPQGILGVRERVG
jgi:branched-chain amino acid transport system permease protein